MFKDLDHVLMVQPAENAIFVGEMAGFLAALACNDLQDHSFVLAPIAKDI